MHKAIEKAIRLAKSQSGLAKILKISPQALGKQLSKGYILPKYCIALEKHFPGQITRYELNPEHFGKLPARPECVVIVLQNLQTTQTTI